MASQSALVNSINGAGLRPVLVIHPAWRGLLSIGESCILLLDLMDQHFAQHQLGRYYNASAKWTDWISSLSIKSAIARAKN